jgi:hypothetical protein
LNIKNSLIELGVLMDLIVNSGKYGKFLSVFSKHKTVQLNPANGPL